jgi:hypothetical protein
MFFNILGYSALAPSLRDKSDWLLWAQGKKEVGLDLPDLPNLEFVPLNLRRHLDQNSKIALYTAYEAVKEISGNSPLETLKNIRLVFASRWGEWERTLNLLLDYINEGSISPLRFSYSVHNAPAAILSISAKNRLPYCALSANGATFEMGLIEALAAFADEPEKPALLIYSDEKTPDMYKNAVPFNIPCAAAFLISIKNTGRIRLKYSFRSLEPQTLKDNTINQVFNFIRFLLLDEPRFESGCFSVERV